MIDSITAAVFEFTLPPEFIELTIVGRSSIASYCAVDVPCSCTTGVSCSNLAHHETATKIGTRIAKIVSASAHPLGVPIGRKAENSREMNAINAPVFAAKAMFGCLGSMTGCSMRNSRMLGFRGCHCICH